MQIVRQAGALVMQAPAKVNLFLEVLAKRPDGYHDLETLMVAVNLFDTLKLREEPGGEIRLTCKHPDLSTGSDNLVNRAAALLKQQTGCEKGAPVRPPLDRARSEPPRPDRISGTCRHRH